MQGAWREVHWASVLVARATRTLPWRRCERGAVAVTARGPETCWRWLLHLVGEGGGGGDHIGFVGRDGGGHGEGAEDGGRADDAGDVNVNDDMVDSGVSGVSGVWGDDETEYGGALACTGTGGGMGLGGDVDGGC